MAKNCASKKDKVNLKVKREASSNLARELCEYDETYINTIPVTILSSPCDTCSK